MPFSRITLQEIDNYIEAINRASDFDQVLDLLQRQINILGFDKMTYWLRWHKNDTRNPVLLSTYPEKFLKYYAEENFQNHDMVGTYSNFTSTPFAWSDIGKKFDITRKQKILFHDSSSVGLRSGGSIPIHGPGLVKATFSVSNDERDTTFDRLFTFRRHELQIIATYAHEKIMSLGLDGPVLDKELTAREIDILSWVAAGKSYWEISVISSIQEDTVKKHMKNIFQKLGVTNKSHAVSKAIIHGIIAP